jgi:hypothetical protein
MASEAISAVEKRGLVRRNSLKFQHIPKSRLRQDEEAMGRKSAYFLPKILPKISKFTGR